MLVKSLVWFFLAVIPTVVVYLLMVSVVEDQSVALIFASSVFAATTIGVITGLRRT